MYRCRFQFLRECPDSLFGLRLQVIKRAIERHNEANALLRIILPFEHHNRPFFENITILGLRFLVSSFKCSIHAPPPIHS